MLKLLIRMLLTSVIAFGCYTFVFNQFIEPTLETVKSELNSAVINPIKELERISGGDWSE